MSSLSRHSPRGIETEGFTLVEVMTSIVVLAILGVILAQAFQASSVVLSRSNKDTDAFSDMRQALDRIGLDLAARISRNDVPIYFVINTGNDNFSFYSAVASTASSASNPRGISQVSYRIGLVSGPTSYCLQRASEGVLWGGGGTAPLVFVNPAASLPAAPSPPPDADFDVVAPSVFRLEISYVSASASPGNIVNTVFSSQNPTSAGQWQTEVGAICVTLAALDPDSRKQLKSPTTQLAQLAQLLPDSTNNQSTLGTWNGVVQNSGSLATAAGIPLTVAEHVRVMERRFPLN